MRLALIANDRSGAGLHPSDLETLLRAHGATVDTFTLEDRRQAAGGGYDRVVVAGGDGSIGCAAELAGELGVPLAVVAAGTANDFARAHGLPTHLDAAAELAANGRRLVRHELGRVAGQPFVNVASTGLAPAAARHAEALKGLLGPVAYAVGALRAGLTEPPVHCAVQVDGRTLYEGDAWQVIVSISGHFGGGSSVDEAEPDDGVLHVTVIPGGSRLLLPWRAVGLRLGSIAGQGGVLDGEGRAIDLGLADGAELNVDGELLPAGPLTVEPGAFSLVTG
ncbi:MAG TPA: diacylglycerol kinase family protein [Solirubrobacteraceae bacterium]|jgi:diacylglycerol kinase family enzyme